ncbi:MazG-like family protein [Sphingorhabdus sp.]|uniref:MazG-like family protein n=1 Tax=Sphingorhabdus sp. TaxID=1902408 RepID=UPI00333ED91A
MLNNKWCMSILSLVNNKLTEKFEIPADYAAEPVIKTFEDLVNAVEDWAEARQIIPNSNPTSQLMKTMSELGELADATIKGDDDGRVDGVGDVLVTLILYCALADLDIVGCLAGAYDTIKDRKGTLTAEGIFVKEPE